MHINNYLSNTGKSNWEQTYARGRPRSSIKEKFNNSNMRKTEVEERLVKFGSVENVGSSLEEKI